MLNLLIFNGLHPETRRAQWVCSDLHAGRS